MSTVLAAVVTGLALVTQEATPLRSAPTETAPAQAQLWPGDALEVRGEKLGYLQVWDPRRERPGYVRASQVRKVNPQATQAPELLAVVRFVRDTPGAESLGVAYAAAYLKAVPTAQLDPEAFDALGQMGERLADRASSRAAVVQAQAGITAAPSGGADARLAGHLDGVAAYGVKFNNIDYNGSVRLCYDGQAYQQVLAWPSSTPSQKARAVLGLTRHDCVPTSLIPSQRVALDQARAEWLDRLKPAEWAALSEQERNQLRLRRAGVWAALAHARARAATAVTAVATGSGSEAASVQAAGQRAVQELAAIQKSDLSDDDWSAYQEAAVRVGASRWAGVVAGEPPAAGRAGLSVLTQPGQPGETCVLLVDAQHGAGQPLFKRCTWGVPWLASVRVHPQGQAVALAVQPLATWRELWVMKATAQGWQLEVLAPATGQVDGLSSGRDVGYIEWAGWALEAQPKLLLAREAWVERRWTRRFEVLRLEDLGVDKQAASAQALSAFKRWGDPVWAQQTVAVR